MSKLKYLKHEKDAYVSMLDIIQTYEQIAAWRMRKVKKSVLTGREFLSGISDAFGYVLYAYNAYRQEMKKIGKTVHKIASKRVYVLITSNTGLYGAVVKDTTALFMADYAEIRKTKSDIVVIGDVGKRYLAEHLPDVPYKFFHLSDFDPEKEVVDALLTALAPYREIVAYHGVFRNIVRQEAQKTHVTGELMRIEESIKGQKSFFLFEPSVIELADYFEKQLLATLVEQSLYEAYLSRFASRMVHLDESASRIELKYELLRFSFIKEKHKVLNNHLISSVYARELWKK